MKRPSLIPTLLVLLLLSSCSTEIPEPTPLPDPPTVAIEIPVVTDLDPSPISLGGQTYSFENGRACLKTNEEYNNVRGSFSLPVSEFFVELLDGLGYDVLLNPQLTDDCDLIVDLTFKIELLSASYGYNSSQLAGDQCYSGIMIDSQLNLKVPEKGVQELHTFGHGYEPPQQITSCSDIEDNPLVAQWTAKKEEGEAPDKRFFLSMLEQLWGIRASIVVLGIEGNLAGLEILHYQARQSVSENEFTNSDVNYYIRAAEKNPSAIGRLLNVLPPNIDNEELIPITLTLLSDEELSEYGVYKLINILQELQPNEEYTDAAAPIIFELAPSYFGDGWRESESENFIKPAVNFLAGLGPDMIPHAVWYLAHHDEVEPEQVILAAGILSRLARDGYKDQVVQQAGHYLCYVYFLNENGEFVSPGNVRDNTIPNLLAYLFPDVVNGSDPNSGRDTKPIKFYRAWEKLYGE